MFYLGITQEERVPQCISASVKDGKKIVKLDFNMTLKIQRVFSLLIHKGLYLLCLANILFIAIIYEVYTSKIKV